MAASLSSLPAELFSLVVAHLSGEDILALRLTCRNAESHTFSQFTKKYFRSKCFMFTTESLRILKAIADSDRLRAHLHHIYITPILFDAKARKIKVHVPREPDQQHYHKTFKISEPKLPDHVRAVLNTYDQDQKELRRLGKLPGGDRRFLADSFKQLSALHSIQIVRDLYKSDARVTCMGLNTLLRRTRWLRSLNGFYQFDLLDVSLTSGEHTKWRQYVLDTVILALSDAGSSTVSRLGLTIEDAWWSNLASEPSFRTKLGQSLASIETVKLRINTLMKSMGHQKPPEERAAEEINNLKSLSAAVSNASRISFSTKTQHEDIHVSYLSAFLESIDLPRLTSFHIEGVMFHGAELVEMISSMTSVMHIRLERISVFGGWLPVLYALSKLPKLTHLDLLEPRESLDAVSFWNPACYSRVNELPIETFKKCSEHGIEDVSLLMINAYQRDHLEHGGKLSGPVVSVPQSTQAHVLGADYLEYVAAGDRVNVGGAVQTAHGAATDPEAFAPARVGSKPHRTALGTSLATTECFHRYAEEISDTTRDLPHWHMHCMTGPTLHDAFRASRGTIIWWAPSHGTGPTTRSTLPNIWETLSRQ